MAMKVIDIVSRGSRYEKYKDRLVLIIVKSVKATSRIILTERVLMALDHPQYVQIGYDGNGRFGVRNAVETAPNRLKVVWGKGESQAHCAGNSLINAIRFPTYDKTRSLVYPASVSPDGWVEVDMTVDKPSIA